MRRMQGGGEREGERIVEKIKDRVDKKGKKDIILGKRQKRGELENRRREESSEREKRKVI